MSAFAYGPHPAPLYTCPWCPKYFEAHSQEEVKQHYRSHMYDDFKNHKMSKLEASAETQEKLKRYLESILDK